MINEPSFEGEFAVDPPLTTDEQNAIAAQNLPIPERAKVPRGACHWVSNGDGTAIIWDRDPDFDRSVDWYHCGQSAHIPTLQSGVNSWT